MNQWPGGNTSLMWSAYLIHAFMELFNPRFQRGQSWTSSLLCVSVCECVCGGESYGPVQLSALPFEQLQSAQGERATMWGGGEVKQGSSTQRKSGTHIQKVRRNRGERKTLPCLWYKTHIIYQSAFNTCTRSHTPCRHTNTYAHTWSCTCSLAEMERTKTTVFLLSTSALSLSLCSIHPALLCAA